MFSRTASTAFRWIILAFAVLPACAIITLGTSKETLTLTGIGANPSNQGQSKIKWGDCQFDGTNSTCTLSGPFTGFGAGGTYKFIVSYPGNGAFPLNAGNNPGSDLFSAQATGPLNFQITLTQPDGSVLPFYSFANFSFQFSGATCTVVALSQCSVSGVGGTPNATISGPITGSFNQAPVISTGGVISAASYGGARFITSGTWVEIYGVNLANVRGQTWAGGDFNGVLAPSKLGGRASRSEEKQPSWTLSAPAK